MSDNKNAENKVQKYRSAASAQFSFDHFIKVISRKPKRKFLNKLTLRERECLVRVEQGKNLMEIAADLSISKYCVEFYLKNVWLKCCD